MSARQRLIDTTIALMRLNVPDGKPELVYAATDSLPSGLRRCSKESSSKADLAVLIRAKLAQSG